MRKILSLDRSLRIRWELRNRYHVIGFMVKHANIEAVFDIHSFKENVNITRTCQANRKRVSKESFWRNAILQLLSFQSFLGTLVDHYCLYGCKAFVVVSHRILLRILFSCLSDKSNYYPALLRACLFGHLHFGYCSWVSGCLVVLTLFWRAPFRNEYANHRPSTPQHCSDHKRV